jgi:hypothetical protein
MLGNQLLQCAFERVQLGGKADTFASCRTSGLSIRGR